MKKKKIIPVEGCNSCPFHSYQTEQEDYCTIYEPEKGSFYRRLTNDEYVMEYQLPTEEKKFPNLCPLGSTNYFLFRREDGDFKIQILAQAKKL